MQKLDWDIHPVTDFKRHATSFLRSMKKSGRPLVLTVNGKAAVVVQDARGYQQLLDRMERLEFVAAVKAGMKQEAEGNLVPALGTLRRMKAEIGLHSEDGEPRRR